MRNFFKKIHNNLKEDIQNVHNLRLKARERISNRFNQIKNRIENRINSFRNDNNNNSNNSNNSEDLNNNNNNLQEENNDDLLENFYNQNNINNNKNNNNNNNKKEIIKLKNEEDIPQNYLCPISYQIMTDPVITPYGISYDRESIENWLKINKMDPIAHKKLDKNMLIPNYALKSLIEEYINANKIN